MQLVDRITDGGAEIVCSLPQDLVTGLRLVFGGAVDCHDIGRDVSKRDCAVGHTLRVAFKLRYRWSLEVRMFHTVAVTVAVSDVIEAPRENLDCHGVSPSSAMFDRSESALDE